MREFTGEQIAQVDNADPFAAPVWRSPVHRTPEWVIWLVQLIRLVIRVVWFLVRHPLLDVAAGAVVTTWAETGWPGVVVLACVAVAVLVTLRVWWPDWYARLRFLSVEEGIRQFLDIGTGLPTADNTHEVAQRLAPESRVVYVYNDLLVLAHARALLTSTPPGVTAYLDADVHRPSRIIDEAAETLDFSQPVAVMMLGILNFVLDTTEAEAIVNHLMEAVPSGSYLAVSHPTTELGCEANREAMRFWNEHVQPPPITARTGAEIRRFLAGLQLAEPGLVPCTQWRPDPVEVGAAAPQVALYAGVARKP